LTEVVEWVSGFFNQIAAPAETTRDDHHKVRKIYKEIAFGESHG